MAPDWLAGDDWTLEHSERAPLLWDNTVEVKKNYICFSCYILQNCQNVSMQKHWNLTPHYVVHQLKPHSGWVSGCMIEWVVDSQKLYNHNIYWIIIFHHVDNTQSTGHNQL